MFDSSSTSGIPFYLRSLVDKSEWDRARVALAKAASLREL